MTKGYDPLFSVELKSKRTKNSKTFLNIDGSLTTIFYAEGKPFRKNATYYSIAADDGDILETGLVVNTANDYIRCSETPSPDYTYRSFVSFDTSAIPDDAVIDSAYLRVLQNDCYAAGTAQIDYCLYGALTSDDFGRAAEASNIATILLNSVAWHNSGTFTNVNVTGKSQYRLIGLTANMETQFRSGDHASKPELHVTYTTPPAAPSNCLALYVAVDDAKCTWQDNSDNETGFRIEKAIDGEGFSFWKNVGAGVEDSGTYTLGANKRIKFRVRAYNAAGDSDWSTSGYVHSTPSIPTGLAAAWLVEYETVRLTYTKNQAYGDIDVYSQVDGDGFAHLAYDDVSPYDDETPGGEDYKYEYKIRARSPQNDDSSYTYSAFTDIETVYSTVTLSESIGLLESLPVIDRQLTLEEAIALRDVSDVPACADQVLETAIALAPQFEADEQTIVRVAATAEFLAEQAKRSNQPAKRIWLFIDSTLYDITDRFQFMGPIDREMTYKPGETNRLTISDQTLVMSNADKYFSDRNPDSPFYDRDYAGADTIRIYAGFIIPSTGYAEVLQKADMKLLYTELETKPGIARLGCEDSFRDLFDKYVGMPTSEGASDPEIYIDKTFKFIMDDLLQTHAGIPAADCDIEDVDLTFDSVTWEKKTISWCIQQISEVAGGSTVLMGDGTVKFRQFTSESTSIDLVLRPGQAYAALKYRGQDFHWKINKVVVIGDEVYAEAEISGALGRTLKIENTEIESEGVASSVAVSSLGRFAVKPTYVEIRGEYLPSLELGDVLEIHEPSSMMDPEILAVRKLALDIAGFSSTIWATPLSAGGGSKIWSSKAELEDGTLVSLLVPEGLNRLELKRKELSGTATYIFDVGVDKTADWIFFNHSEEDTKIILRDQFLENTLSEYYLEALNAEYPNYSTPSYDSANKRISFNTPDDYGFTLRPKDISIGDFILSFNFLLQAYKGDDHGMFLAEGRWVNHSNMYMLYSLGPGHIYSPNRIAKIIAGVDNTISEGGTGWFSLNTQYQLVVTINGNNLKVEIPGFTLLSTTDTQFPDAGPVKFGAWQAKGWIDNLLLEHHTLPSPAGTTVTFKFWSSDNGDDWTGPHTAIGDVADSRYIKIEVTMARDNLAKAMPVLNDMTVGYFLKGS